MRRQYGQTEGIHFRESPGLSINSVGLKDRYAKSEHKASPPYEPTSTKPSNSYYSKSITNASLSYPKQQNYKYSTPFKTPVTQSFNTEYKSSFSNSYTPYKNSAFTKHIADNIQAKCLTNRDNEQEPTDLGRKVALKLSKETTLSGYEPANYSLDFNGIVEAYASNSNKGLIR